MASSMFINCRPKNVSRVKCGEKGRLEYSLMKILNANLSFPELKGSRNNCFLGESLLCVICVLAYHYGRTTTSRLERTSQNGTPKMRTASRSPAEVADF